MNNLEKLLTLELPPGYDPKKDAIELVAYDSNWPAKALNEINRIKAVLTFPWFKDIQHVGSTAIPNIMAKPIIDIYVGIANLEFAADAVAVIKPLGYQCVVQYPNIPMKNKICLIKDMPPFGVKRTHHTHIVEYQGDHWNDALLFRDYLRNHPEEAKNYEKLKIALMQKFEHDREGYTNGKDEYVAKILKKGGFKRNDSYRKAD